MFHRPWEVSRVLLGPEHSGARITRGSEHPQSHLRRSAREAEAPVATPGSPPSAVRGEDQRGSKELSKGDWDGNQRAEQGRRSNCLRGEGMPWGLALSDRVGKPYGLSLGYT